MREMEIEFTNDTLVLTEQGVERLADILRRPVSLCLWGIKWLFDDRPNGISFHKSHRLAKKFAESQIDSVPDGPAKLVNVSQHIYNCVEKNEYCWTNLGSFADALTYKDDTWLH